MCHFRDIAVLAAFIVSQDSIKFFSLLSFVLLLHSIPYSCYDPALLLVCWFRFHSLSWIIIKLSCMRHRADLDNVNVL